MNLLQYYHFSQEEPCPLIPTFFRITDNGDVAGVKNAAAGTRDICHDSIITICAWSVTSAKRLLKVFLCGKITLLIESAIQLRDAIRDKEHYPRTSLLHIHFRTEFG